MTKTAKCPVCQWEIKDNGQEIKAGGKIVIVCCDDCAKKVKSDPMKYIRGK